MRSSVDLPVPLRPMTQTRSRGSTCRLASASSGRWPYAIETRSRVARGIWRLGGVLPDRRQEQIAEVGGLAHADASDAEQRVERRGTQPRHLAKRHVMEDDVRRHPARARDLEAHGAQPLEERPVNAFP